MQTSKSYAERKEKFKKLKIDLSLLDHNKKFAISQ
jgi:hypothetical protein